jgi:hypothetical protein
MRLNDMDLSSFVEKKEAVLFSDLQRESFKIIGELYKKSLESIGFTINEIRTPTQSSEREKLNTYCEGKIVFHNTVGFSFWRVPNAYNIALAVHEWSQFPKEWVTNLNTFEEIWVTTNHVKKVLLDSGVHRPVLFMPPSLIFSPLSPKKQWTANNPFKFLSIGEPHFRKGFHLLMLGYQEAFPKPFEATLTIKTSESCVWESPRKDIVIIKKPLEREGILSLYPQFDCYVSASLGEGLGLPVAEAVLSSLPVATNYWGGHESLLIRGGFFEIKHKIVDQPFCSNPDYYADGQKCAFSRPADIARTLRRVFESSPSERQHIAMVAKEYLGSAYGSDVTHRNICERLR